MVKRSKLSTGFEGHSGEVDGCDFLQIGGREDSQQFFFSLSIKLNVSRM